MDPSHIDPGDHELRRSTRVTPCRAAARLTIETASGGPQQRSMPAATSAWMPAAMWMLAVSGTGSGMDRAAKARLFEAIFFTDQGERGKGHRTGALHRMRHRQKLSGGEIAKGLQ